MEKFKLVFTKDGVAIFEKRRSPFGGNIKDIEIEKIGYGSLLENKNLNMVVRGIRPKIEDNILKELIFDVEFEPEFTSQGITPNTDDERGIIIGSERMICRKYNEILINVAKWLFENNRITKKDLPIYGLNSRQYLLNLEPKHPTGNEFAGNPRKISGVYLNVTWSGLNTKKQAKYLMDRFAPDVNFQIFGFK